MADTISYIQMPNTSTPLTIKDPNAITIEISSGSAPSGSPTLWFKEV